MRNSTNSQDHIRLLELLRDRSFARKKVVLASGRESDFFIDCKQTVLTAEGHYLTGKLLLASALNTVEFDAVAGVESGGYPLASAVAYASFLHGIPKDALYVRKRPKNHGSERLIEGNDRLLPNASIVILEDVVTTGKSALQAAEILQQAGYSVSGIIALVDRSEGADELFDKAGISFYSLYLKSYFIQESQ